MGRISSRYTVRQITLRLSTDKTGFNSLVKTLGLLEGSRGLL